MVGFLFGWKFCAESPQTPPSSGCYADSGSPLVYNGRVLGVLSHGTDCGRSHRNPIPVDAQGNPVMLGGQLVGKVNLPTSTVFASVPHFYTAISQIMTNVNNNMPTGWTQLNQGTDIDLFIELGKLEYKKNKLRLSCAKLSTA